MIQARFPSIFYLDTNEEPSKMPILEIKSFFKNENTLSSVSSVKILNEFYFLGKKLHHGSYHSKSAEIRLFKKDAFSYSGEEKFLIGVSVSGQVHRFKNSYRHFKVNSLSEWFIKTNQYTESDAQAFQGSPKRSLELIGKQGFRGEVDGFSPSQRIKKRLPKTQSTYEKII